MWFARIYDEYVEIYIEKIFYKIPVKKCCSLYKKNNFFYFLTNRSIYCYLKNKLIFRSPLINGFSNKIIVNDNIYISGEDTGTIYLYDLNGKIQKSHKMGEHISDFDIYDSIFFCAIYHENKIIKADMETCYEEIVLKYTPQTVIYSSHLYVLANDSFYSVIYMLDSNLNKIKEIYFDRQLGSLYKYNNKLVFNGNEYNYILTENLHLLSQKRSTGETLCRFSNVPVFEYSKKILDTVNNIIYPL